MSALLAAPMGVGYTVIVTLSRLLAPVAGSFAAAAAIIAITVALRLLLTPLTWYAMRGQARIAALQPRVQDLRARFARQPDRLQAELGALYRQHGGAALAGFLPLLLQLPVFAIVYRLLESPTVRGTRNMLLTRTLFGTSLGSHWLTGAGPLSSHGLVFLAVFALLAAVGWAALRAARPDPAALGQATGAPGALIRLLPFSTLLIAAFVPLAAGLYLLTSTGWAVAERAVLRRTLPTAPPALAARPR